jgi:hypothetical protein
MSYSNDRITQALQPYAESFHVALQPIYDDRVLDLYLNRPPELAANCSKLVAVLKRQIARQFPEVRTVYFYSRVWGKETIDWEAQVEMPQFKPTPLPPPPPSPNLAQPQRPHHERSESTPTPRHTPNSNTTNNHSTLGGARQSPKSRDVQPNGIPNPNTPNNHSRSNSGGARQSSKSRDVQPNGIPNPNTPSDHSRSNSGGARQSSKARDIPQDEIANAPEPKPEQATSEPEEFVLQKFCFSRNRRLVEGPLKNPEPDMAELIQFFHHLDEAGKRQLLPLLETWLKEPEKVDISSLPEATQTWLREANSNPDKLRSTGVWLSRYCFDPEKTMEQVNATFAGIVAAETADDEQVKSDSEVFHPDSGHQDRIHSGARSRRDSRSGARSGGGTGGNTSAQTETSQKFSKSELIPLGGTLVAILVLGWLLSFLVRLTGGLGLLVAICAIGSGIGFSTGNKTLRGFFSFLLFMISIGGGFIFGAIIGVVGLPGWLIGAIIGVSVTTIAKQSEAPSILSPKPLRMAAVLTLGLLLTLGSALFSGGGGSGGGGLTVNSQDAGKGQVLTTHVASGTVAGDGKAFEFKGAAAIWDEANKQLRISLLPVPVTDGDLKMIQQYLKAESSSDVDGFPARYLAEARPSHKPEQFAQMPAAQFDLRFADGATTFTSETLWAFDFILFWEGSWYTVSAVGHLADQLQILKFEPKEGGTLSLVANPTDVESPFSDEEMRIDLKVNTKVALKKS